MKKIAVFCGASKGKDSKYVENAFKLGELFVQNNIGLVYGGASIGVMGAIADSVLLKQGKAWGVIPQSIVDMEVGHQNLTDLIIVDSMHDRKKKMYDLSDAFFIIPGGMGTLDEFCEILTWAQLNFHDKPIYLINEDGFYKHLMAHFRYAADQGFISEKHMELVREFETGEAAIEDFLKHNPS